jgi:hypothetical protein
MSTDKALNFSFGPQLKEDFMKMIWTLAEVKSVLEEIINLNKEINSVEFIKQDLKTLENAKNAILDEEIVLQFENIIKKKKEDFEKKESAKTENDAKKVKLLRAYDEFKAYSRIVKNMYDSVKDNLSINVDKLDTAEHLAFLFADIRLNAEMSGSELNYDKAADIFINSKAAVKQLFEAL